LPLLKRIITFIVRRRTMTMKVAVTGVSRGIGEGFARAYLEAGAQVYGGARSTDAEAVQRLQQSYPQQFRPFTVDVADRDSVRRAVRELSAVEDRIDLLINNAGTAREPNEASLDDIHEEDILEVFNTNTLGPLRCVQEFLPLLRGSSRAKVVFISSSAGSISGQGGGRGVPYCVSKGALNMLAKLLYFHLREEGIPSAAIHPGWVRTDMGGGNAHLSVEESVAAMMKTIESLNLQSPNYMDYRGEAMEY
jgi:NAD(P)-dependent dehydrogenase (short-subunit alcohol dehydrogenase family)